MDPFEVRMQFVTLLRRLTSKQQDIQRAVAFAVKHGPKCGDDLWDCLIEECENANLNSRINILHFLDSLLTSSSSTLSFSLPPPPLPSSSSNPSASTSFNPNNNNSSISLPLPLSLYPALLLRDLPLIIRLVVPSGWEGRLNAMSARQVLRSWRTKRVFGVGAGASVAAGGAGDSDGEGSGNDQAGDDLGVQVVEKVERELEERVREGMAMMARKKEEEEAGGGGAENESSSAEEHGFTKNDVRARIDDDRERHKRLRERLWILPIPPTLQPLPPASAFAVAPSVANATAAAVRAAVKNVNEPINPISTANKEKEENEQMKREEDERMGMKEEEIVEGQKKEEGVTMENQASTTTPAAARTKTIATTSTAESDEAKVKTEKTPGSPVAPVASPYRSDREIKPQSLSEGGEEENTQAKAEEKSSLTSAAVTDAVLAGLQAFEAGADDDKVGSDGEKLGGMEVDEEESKIRPNSEEVTLEKADLEEGEEREQEESGEIVMEDGDDKDKEDKHKEEKEEPGGVSHASVRASKGSSRRGSISGSSGVLMVTAINGEQKKKKESSSLSRSVGTKRKRLESNDDHGNGDDDDRRIKEEDETKSNKDYDSDSLDESVSDYSDSSDDYVATSNNKQGFLPRGVVDLGIEIEFDQMWESLDLEWEETVQERRRERERERKRKESRIVERRGKRKRIDGAVKNGDDDHRRRERTASPSSRRLENGAILSGDEHNERNIKAKEGTRKKRKKTGDGGGGRRYKLSEEDREMMRRERERCFHLAASQPAVAEEGRRNGISR